MVRDLVRRLALECLEDQAIQAAALRERADDALDDSLLDQGCRQCVHQRTGKHAIEGLAHERARGQSVDGVGRCSCAEVCSRRDDAGVRPGSLAQESSRGAHAGPSARNISVAFTRRLTSSASRRSSFMKIALMCFSTARLVRNSDSAIAALLLPCAISASTSDSRSLNSDKGDASRRERASTSASTTFGSTTDSPSTTALIARTSCSSSLIRSLRRYARRAEPCSNSASAYAGSTYWLSTTTPTVGSLSWRSWATLIPSSVPVGGMRMSVTTTSGCLSAISDWRL